MKKAGNTDRKRYIRDLNERRENALRPSRYLGYDHDALGLHLLSREAFEIAVHCFRRAIWLNPFEPAFKTHMALCLYKLGRYAEAFELLSTQSKKDKDTQMLLELVEGKLKKNEYNQT